MSGEERCEAKGVHGEQCVLRWGHHEDGQREHRYKPPVAAPAPHPRSRTYGQGCGYVIALWLLGAMVAVWGGACGALGAAVFRVVSRWLA